jgi:hypothetical protein
MATSTGPFVWLVKGGMTRHSAWVEASNISERLKSDFANLIH